MEKPLLPPLFESLAVMADEDPFAAAVAAAPGPQDLARFFWCARSDRMECAVVLAPDRPLRQALPVLQVASVALGDTLGALLPPQIAVTFGWPDRLLLNGAVAGGVRVAAAPQTSTDATPAWMVLGAALQLMPPPDAPEPGTRQQQTTLWDEGGGELTATQLLESFARHFLLWVNRWEADGLRAVFESWLARAAERSQEAAGSIGALSWQGTMLGLDEEGGLLLRQDDLVCTVPLSHALQGCSWALVQPASAAAAADG